jgi:hypothetical protein
MGRASGGGEQAVLHDSYSTFNAWVGPLGYMLKLEQEGSGLRVEREPSPSVKRRDQATPELSALARRLAKPGLRAGVPDDKSPVPGPWTGR